jgi:hypothetical protein
MTKKVIFRGALKISLRFVGYNKLGCNYNVVVNKKLRKRENAYDISC